MLKIILTLGNQKADKLARGIEVDEEITITDTSETYSLKLKLERNPQTGQYQIPQFPKLRLKREGNILTNAEDEPLRLTPEFIKNIHEQLGHPRQTAMINWFTQRNLAAKIEDINKGINGWNTCKNMFQFRRTDPPGLDRPQIPNFQIQIDFIGPLKCPFAQKYAYTLVQE